MQSYLFTLRIINIFLLPFALILLIGVFWLLGSISFEDFKDSSLSNTIQNIGIILLYLIISSATLFSYLLPYIVKYIKNSKLWFWSSIMIGLWGLGCLLVSLIMFSFGIELESKDFWEGFWSLILGILVGSSAFYTFKIYRILHIGTLS